MTTLAPTLQAFFIGCLGNQRHASSHTVAAYRDTWRLLLVFAADRTGKAPHRLDLGDLDAELIGRFLDHLETDRGNCARTRNSRLAAIHSMFEFAAPRHPEHAADISRVLAIPAKQLQRTIVGFLTDTETDALLAAPDRTTPTGRRDHALLLLAIETGLRAAELTALTVADVSLGAGPHVHCRGKGRKDRITPLTATAATVLRTWISEHAAAPTDPLFPSNRGTPMSSDALRQRVALHAARAAQQCTTLAGRTTGPNTLRHTAAMRLLHAGVDITVIALWLGHESTETTHIYLQADLAIKEQALARTAPIDTPPGRYQPGDQLLQFLQNL